MSKTKEQLEMERAWAKIELNSTYGVRPEPYAWLHDSETQRRITECGMAMLSAIIKRTDKNDTI